MAYVRIGDHVTAGMADTGSKRTIMDRVLARNGDAVALAKTGTMNIAGHALRGRLMRVTIQDMHEPTCMATVDAFVPDAGQPF